MADVISVKRTIQFIETLAYRSMLTPSSVRSYSNVRTVECCVPTLAVSFLFNSINRYYLYDVLYDVIIIIYIVAYLSWTLSFKVQQYVSYLSWTLSFKVQQYVSYFRCLWLRNNISTMHHRLFRVSSVNVSCYSNIN